MNAARTKINGNYNNNDNYEVSNNMLTTDMKKLHHEQDLHSYLETHSETNLPEPQMARVFISPDSARKSRRQQDDEKSKNEDDESEKDEHSTDEVDGPKNKYSIQMDDDAFVNDEIEVEDTETKKINSYAAKKTVAQGMMDIALITANANQLRYIIEFNSESPTFYVVVTLISFSLVLQVAVGMALIFKGRLDIKGKSKDPDAKRINNYVVVAIFLVTIINVFIASFTVTGNGGKTH